MNTFYIIIIFVIVLFLYVHIIYHYKTNSDLEIYEIQDTNKDSFENICNLRQPVLFPNDFFQPISENFLISNLTKNFKHFDVNLRNSSVIPPNSQMNQYKSFLLEDCLNIIRSNNNVFSENNSSFLDETCLTKSINQIDELLRPPNLVYKHYDLMIGSKCFTPLKYEVAFRTFLMPIEDNLKIKVVPPKYHSFMDIKKDYEYFQFLSNDNLWIETYNKKIKSITFTINVNQIIYIPAYWFYSIHFNTPNAVLLFKYFTLMNIISITPDLSVYLFQQQNIKHKTPCIIKKFDKIESEVIKKKEKKPTSTTTYKLTKE